MANRASDAWSTAGLSAQMASSLAAEKTGWDSRWSAKGGPLWLRIAGCPVRTSLWGAACRLW